MIVRDANGIRFEARQRVKDVETDVEAIVLEVQQDQHGTHWLAVAWKHTGDDWSTGHWDPDKARVAKKGLWSAL